MSNIFFNKKPLSIILTLNNKNKQHYSSDISAKTHCTYAHTVNILKKFKEMELITTKKEGRTVLIELTDKGRKVAEYFIKVEDELGRGKVTTKTK